MKLGITDGSYYFKLTKLFVAAVIVLAVIVIQDARSSEVYDTDEVSHEAFLTGLAYPDAAEFYTEPAATADSLAFYLNMIDSTQSDLSLSDAYAWLGNHFLKAGNLWKAERMYKLLLATATDSVLRIQTLVQLGEIHRTLDQFPEALVYYKDAHASVSIDEDPELWFPITSSLADLYTKNGDFAAAQTLYALLERHTSTAGERARLRLLHGEVIALQGDSEKALQIWNAIPVNSLTSELLSRLWLNLAEVYSNQQRFALAENYLSALRDGMLPSESHQLLKYYEVESLLFADHGAPDIALQMKKKAFALADSIRTDETNRKLLQISAQKNFEEEMTRTEHEHRIRKEGLLVQVRTQNAFLWAFLLVGVLLLIVIRIAYQKAQEFKINNAAIKTLNDALMEQRFQFEKQGRDLQEMIELKDRLLSILSHDLRQPLAAIASVTDMQKIHEMSDTEFRTLIDQIRRMTNHNTQLLDNLLIWARQQWKGQDVFRPEEFNLAELVQAKLEQFRETAAQKNIVLRNQVLAPVSVYADVSMIDVVLQNLIANAIRFCKSGGHVCISAGRTAADAAVLRVSDEGIGISLENMERLFTSNTFTASEVQLEHDTGLGLIVCRDFVHVNGGRIHVNSEPGYGSTFSIELPMMAS